MIVITAYDRRQAEELLRVWTPQQLLEQARAGRYRVALGAEQAALLEDLVSEWVRQALGALPLRDALLVDPARGALAWDLLCEWLLVERCVLPADTASQDHEIGVQGTAIDLETLAGLALEQPCAERLRAAAQRGLALVAWRDQRHSAESPAAPLLGKQGGWRYPQPERLDLLLPPPPAPMPRALLPFEQPVGRRRVLATALALLGAALIGLPLFFDRAPTRPAGLPLALLTLALLIGIKSRLPGYLGSLCILLVANLPGFHHGSLLTLWPAIPLLAAGLLLLLLDARVRAMWRWIRNFVISERES